MTTRTIQRPVEKVMLIFPPVTVSRHYHKMCCMPMGIAYLGAVLRDSYDVRLLDSVAEGYDQEREVGDGIFQYGLSVDGIMDRVRSFEPDVVGVTCLFSSQFPDVVKISKAVKSWNPEAVTVTGGTHPSFLPEKCLQAESLDYIVMGEAEESFPALLQAVGRGRGIEDVDGLAWRENGSLKVHKKTRWIEDLDSLPFPARDLLPMDKYFKINVPFMLFSRSPRNASFITSRGCPLRCRFCSSTRFWGGRQRKRSPESVLAELEHIKVRYGVEEIKFEDDNLTFDQERAKSIFRGMIDRELNLIWNMPNGVMIKTLADRELLGLMKRAGCYEVILPFESGDQYVLDNIVKKPLDLEQGREIVKMVKEHNIETHAFFIIGFPKETLKQINTTISYARSLKLDKFYLFIYSPLPGTPLYEECVEGGLIEDEDVFQANLYSMPGFSTDEWTAEQLQVMQRSEQLRQDVSLLTRDPVKFFRKYVRRVIRPDNLRAQFYIGREYMRQLITKR